MYLLQVTQPHIPEDSIPQNAELYVNIPLIIIMKPNIAQNMLQSHAAYPSSLYSREEKP
jgi:hypothetical protein